MQPGKLSAPFHASIVHVVALSLNASTMPSIHSPLFIVALFVVFSWFRCDSLLKSMRLNVADIRRALQSREGRDHEKKNLMLSLQPPLNPTLGGTVVHCLVSKSFGLSPKSYTFFSREVTD